MDKCKPAYQILKRVVCTKNISIAQPKFLAGDYVRWQTYNKLQLATEFPKNFTLFLDIVPMENLVMHDSVKHWVAEKLSLITIGKDILEVGSMDLNGSVRSLFPENSKYVGIDLEEGKGVDLVMNSHSLEFFDESFDVVLCLEVLEHDDSFWETMAEMGRVLRHKGYLFITARGNGFPLHEHPGDHYRFMPSSFERLLKLADCEVIETKVDPQLPGMFGLGRKW